MSPDGTGSKKSPLDKKSLQTFEGSFDPTRENSALQTRGEFLRAFPMRKLSALSLEDYVIGLKQPTFCYRVEVQTRAWAIIQGATALKFGVYFGRTKGDPKKIYRFKPQYGSAKVAFGEVKSALLNLVEMGGQKELDFSAIDGNPLSQMFKAKILSLYFPERFINICSHEHLEMFASELGFEGDGYSSEYQHFIAETKRSNPIVAGWTNPKFTAFLYARFYPEYKSAWPTVRKPRTRRPGTVDFDALKEAWDKIGKASEIFAWKWEKERLEGAGLSDLVPEMEDRRDRPTYGYDFLSCSAPGVERYIEVKTVKKVRGGGHRCFVSETEHKISQDPAHVREYYFYLVSLRKDGKPGSLTAVRAEDHYKVSELNATAYEMRFDLE